MAALTFPLTTAAEFRARLAEFTSGDYGDGAVVTALEDAALQINANAWGVKAALGQLYLAAHSLALFGPAASRIPGVVATGVVTGETVGEVSRTYSNPYGNTAPGSTDFGLTRYGQMYERLKRQVIGSPVLL